MFILSKDRLENSQAEFESAWSAYVNYLNSISQKLPKSAYEFAVAEWHYNFNDHRCPHDSWLDRLAIENHHPRDGGSYSLPSITLKLLGAYHDGFIVLTYKAVISYSLSTEQKIATKKDPADWLYDEIRLSDNGNVLHEIEWSDGSVWLIECADVCYEWLQLQ